MGGGDGAGALPRSPSTHTEHRPRGDMAQAGPRARKTVLTAHQGCQRPDLGRPALKDREEQTAAVRAAWGVRLVPAA